MTGKDTGPTSKRNRTCNASEQLNICREIFQSVIGSKRDSPEAWLQRFKDGITAYFKKHKNEVFSIINAVQDCAVFHEAYFEKYLMQQNIKVEREEQCQIHEVLVHALRLCPNYVPLYHIERNLNVIKNALEQVFKCYSDFGFLYQFFDAMHREPTDAAALEDCFKRLEFFLICGKHIFLRVDYRKYKPSNRGQSTRGQDENFSNLLEVDERDVRFIDIPIPSSRDHTPLFLACQSGNLRAATLLLRYGADPCAPGSRFTIEGQNYHKPVYEVVSRLNQNINWQLFACGQRQSAENATNCDVLRQEEQKFVDILRLLAASMTTIPIRFTLDTTTSLADTEPLARLHVRYRHLLQDVQVPRLSNLCRVNIRNQLQTLTSLPGGIDRLPLPKILRRFINFDPV